MSYKKLIKVNITVEYRQLPPLHFFLTYLKPLIASWSCCIKYMLLQ